MSDVNDFRVEVVEDRPKSGMWHCGPNSCWVTVTHLPTKTQVRAYNRNQRKARESAMACIELLIQDMVTGDTCEFPEVLGK